MSKRSVRKLHTALSSYTKLLRTAFKLSDFSLWHHPTNIAIYISVPYKNVRLCFTHSYTMTSASAYVDAYSYTSIFYRDKIFWSLLYTFDVYRLAYASCKK